MNNINEDKASKIYWNSTDRNKKEFQIFSPIGGIRGFGRRMWADLFENTFHDLVRSNTKLLEIGCGGSAFLPYFARKFGFQVYGIDYSEQGCELARKMCDANEVSSKIICADIFDAPVEIQEQFDVVVSFGVAEHFTDTADTLLRFAKFLRPGGLILTVIPNMNGLNGMCQKFLSREVLDLHEVIDIERLRKAHVDAGLAVLDCEYFMFINFGVINPGNTPSLLKRLFFLALKASTGLVWSIESVLGSMPPNQFSSPFLFCVARSTTCTNSVNN